MRSIFAKKKYRVHRFANKKRKNKTYVANADTHKAN